MHVHFLCTVNIRNTVHTHTNILIFSCEDVRKALLSANLPAHLYGGCSFCIGAATTAAATGIENSTIQTLGRWKSSSYLLYIRLNPCHMASLSRSALAQCAIWCSDSPSTFSYHSKTSYMAMYAHCCMYTIVFCLVYTAIVIYLSVNNYVCMLLYVHHCILFSIHCYI